METVGEYLRSLRATRSLPRSTLSFRLNMPEASLEALEADRRPPNLNEIRRLCGFFDVHRDEIVGRVPSRRTQQGRRTIGQEPL